jgi:hypothetical protein
MSVDTMWVLRWEALARSYSQARAAGDSWLVPPWYAVKDYADSIGSVAYDSNAFHHGDTLDSDDTSYSAAARVGGAGAWYTKDSVVTVRIGGNVITGGASNEITKGDGSGIYGGSSNIINIPAEGATTTNAIFNSRASAILYASGSTPIHGTIIGGTQDTIIQGGFGIITNSDRSTLKGAFDFSSIFGSKSSHLVATQVSAIISGCSLVVTGDYSLAGGQGDLSDTVSADNHFAWFGTASIDTSGPRPGATLTVPGVTDTDTLLARTGGFKGVKVADSGFATVQFVRDSGGGGGGGLDPAYADTIQLARDSANFAVANLRDSSWVWAHTADSLTSADIIRAVRYLGTDCTANETSAVALGQGNMASGPYSAVGGGELNTASSGYATVGGGVDNTASDNTATVGGGESNTASGTKATVGGGGSNTASGTEATVGGGGGNTASDTEATVGGGGGNTASGEQSTVGGGVDNTASGINSTVPGGANNQALGDYSLAAGNGAIAGDNQCVLAFTAGIYKSDSIPDSALVTMRTMRDSATAVPAYADSAGGAVRVGGLDTSELKAIYGTAAADAKAQDTANAALTLAGQANDTARVALDTVRLARDTANAALTLAGAARDTARLGLARADSLFSPPAWSVTLSGNQVCTTATYTRVRFATENYDTHNAFNTTKYTYFVPAGWGGIYEMTASSQWNAGVDQKYFFTAFTLNGTRVKWSGPEASGTGTFTSGCVAHIACAAGDSLTVQVIHNAGSTMQVNQSIGTYWDGAWKRRLP